MQNIKVTQLGDWIFHLNIWFGVGFFANRSLTTDPNKAQNTSNT